MSKRNWVSGTPAVIFAAAIFLIALGYISDLVSAHWQRVHEANAAYQQNAENDRRQSAIEITEACSNLALEEFRQCLAQNLEAYYRDQATNEDLQAQKDMAFWAMLLFFISCIGLAISTAGVVLLITTIRQGRFGLEQASAAVAAANDANQIMRDELRPIFSHIGTDVRLYQPQQGYAGPPQFDVFFSI